jgi:hypothetical protein
MVFIKSKKKMIIMMTKRMNQLFELINDLKSKCLAEDYNTKGLQNLQQSIEEHQLYTQLLDQMNKFCEKYSD